MHCADLGESFPTRIYLHKLASIQPRSNPLKFADCPEQLTRTGSLRCRDALHGVSMALKTLAMHQAARSRVPAHVCMAGFQLPPACAAAILYTTEDPRHVTPSTANLAVQFFYHSNLSKPIAGCTKRCPKVYQNVLILTRSAWVDPIFAF